MKARVYRHAPTTEIAFGPARRLSFSPSRSPPFRSHDGSLVWTRRNAGQRASRYRIAHPVLRDRRRLIAPGRQVAATGSGGDSDVQGFEQTGGRRACRGRLHRPGQQVGQSVPHRPRRRSRHRHRQARTLACRSASSATGARRAARSRSRLLLRALACHGDLLRRLANASRDGRIAWWRGVRAAA
jgi:hypothetical protein